LRRRAGQPGIDYEFTVTSAHRTPERTAALVAELEAGGCQVFICAAGMAAHLAGAVAAKTVRPVLGIPVTASALGGMDALLATVMMPPASPWAPWPWTRPGPATPHGSPPRSSPWRTRTWKPGCTPPARALKASVDKAAAELAAKK
jgi:5-(carboxyamino)imidazole ribonucleotide mutase